MTRSKQYGSNRQIRFTDDLWNRIIEYHEYCKNKTGIDSSYSDIIRALINEALIAKGILPRDNEDE